MLYLKHLSDYPLNSSAWPFGRWLIETMRVLAFVVYVHFTLALVQSLFDRVYPHVELLVSLRSKPLRCSHPLDCLPEYHFLFDVYDVRSKRSG